jgi:hypothetical protein
MMDHTEYRSAIITDPNDRNPPLLEHRRSCAECAAWTEQLLRFEARLARALQIDVDTRAAEVSLAAATRSADVVSLAQRAALARGSSLRRGGASRRWLALAASVLFGAVVAGAVWIVLPERSLAAEVVDHVAHEPESWHTETAVAEAALNAVLKDSKVKLMPQAGVVVYASSCGFRGHVVPHLVVHSAAGPVTVMVLVHENAHQAKRFDEQGFRGVIVPMQGHGSIAVLMKDANADPGLVERVAATVRDSVVYTD